MDAAPHALIQTPAIQATPPPSSPPTLASLVEPAQTPSTHSTLDLFERATLERDAASPDSQATISEISQRDSIVHKSKLLKGKDKAYPVQRPLQLLNLPVDILREIIGHVS